MEYRRFNVTIKHIGMIWLCLVISGLNPIQAQGRPKVSVMSFNIHAGYGTDGTFDLLRIGNQIKEAQPDMVCLQEVDYRTRRSQGQDVTLELSSITGFHPFFGKAISFDGGAYGLAILSKYPIYGVKVHPLPNLGNAEPRIALECIVHVQGLGAVRVVNVHLDHSNMELHLSQVKFLNKKFTDGEPTIMAGDLNQDMKGKGMQHLKKDWNFSMNANAFTYPSHKPGSKIDYILTYPRNKWKVKNARVYNGSRSSDHLPITVDFYYLE